jgi:hypothetical protein
MRYIVSKQILSGNRQMAKKATANPVSANLLADVGQIVVETLKDRTFECESPYLATVKYADGTFKKKTLMAGWEFFLSYAYVGQRNSLNFGLTPEDAQEYSFVEMTVSEIDRSFPLLGSELAKAFGFKSEKFDGVLVELIAWVQTQKEIVKEEAEASYSDIPEFGMF